MTYLSTSDAMTGSCEVIFIIVLKPADELSVCQEEWKLPMRGRLLC